jgi:hypothetical protein
MTSSLGSMGGCRRCSFLKNGRLLKRLAMAKIKATLKTATAQRQNERIGIIE